MTEAKVPCYEVYEANDDDAYIFRHSQEDELKDHVWILLDSLKAGESIRIVFNEYTESDLDEMVEER